MSEGGEQVKQRPGDDDVVVETDVERNEDDSEAHTWEQNGNRLKSSNKRLLHGFRLTV